MGNTFSGYYSRDGGATWIQQGTTQTVPMTDPVLIGIAVTSHAANQVREFEFSNISTTGKVTGAWTVEDIGVAQPSNEDAMPLYLVVQDSSNRNKVIVHPDANILLSEDWSAWQIPLADFGPCEHEGGQEDVYRHRQPQQRQGGRRGHDLHRQHRPDPAGAAAQQP